MCYVTQEINIFLFPAFRLSRNLAQTRLGLPFTHSQTQRTQSTQVIRGIRQSPPPPLCTTHSRNPSEYKKNSSVLPISTIARPPTSSHHQIPWFLPSTRHSTFSRRSISSLHYLPSKQRAALKSSGTFFGRISTASSQL